MSSSTSPSPNSSAPSSPPNSTPAQPSSPPSGLPTTTGPPPQSLPPAASAIRSPALPSTPSMASPPPQSPPPPEPTASPPQPANLQPPSLTPPPQLSTSPPPPPPVDPPVNTSPPNPRNSPPPPSTNQPPPPSTPPVSPPPRSPPSTNPPPPPTKPPSPPAQPPESSPSPPLPKPPDSSPPPPQPKPPESSPTPPSSAPPENSPQPPSNPGTTPVPPRSQPASPPSNSPPLSPPPPAIQTSPPSPFPPSPPSPSRLSPATPSTNSSRDSAPRNSRSGGGGGLGTGGTVAIVVVLSLVFLGILGAAACCLKKRKKASGQNGGYIMPTSSGSSQEADSASVKVQVSEPNNGSVTGTGTRVVNSPQEPGGFGNSRTWFTYQELVEATNGFSNQNLLGEGGFGLVYKGSLADGRVVAVKQLRIGGGQGEREFRAEVEIISRIHHRHLVSLVGYCINENRRLLVYDYVSNNNLYFHLHGEDRNVLDWGMRAKIALGAARGIAYLHEDCHPRIIHRDIKSSNILLDNNFEARVSDFGLAKLAGDANTHITTRVMGTFGYLAPEYASTGKLTENSDTYSFGVVLLELITGRKPVDASRDESLVEWARPRLSRALETQEFEELADPMLNSQYIDSDMFRIVETAAACVRHSSLKRPKMGQVVRALDTMASTDLTNGMRVGESGQQSSEIRLYQKMAFGNQSFSTGFFRQDSWISEGSDQVNSRIE